MANAILRGKPDAGNPHARFDEGEVASAKPRRGSLLYKLIKSTPLKAMIILFAVIGSAFAQTCTWTGAKGDGKWSSAENWAADAKPVSGRGDVVTVDGAGAVGGVIDNDISGLEIAQLILAGGGYALSGEKITVTAATQAIKKTGTTSAVSLEAPVEFTSESGEVTLSSNDKVLNVKGVLSGDVKVVFDGGTFYLYSANAYTGGTQLKSGTLSLYNPTCFGLAGTTVTAPGTLTFIEPGEYAYDFVLTATGDFSWNFQPGSTRPTGDFTFSGTVSVPNSTGKWDINRTTSDGTHKIVFMKEVSAPKAKLASNAPKAWTVEYHDAVTAAGTYGGYWASDLAPWFEFYKDAALGAVTPCRQVRIRAKADDVFTTHPPIVFNCSIQAWSGTDDLYNIGLFDMAGHDLTMDRIEHATSYLASPSGQIYSSNGATTLRLEGTTDATTVALVKNEVSLVWAPKTTGLTQTFQGRVQKTTGSITVTNGVFRATGATSWASVPKIRVEQDGEFRLETSLVNALKGVGKIELVGNGRLTVVSGDTVFGVCSLELSADSRLTLPDGSYYVFDSVTVDGKELAGDYSGDPSSEDYLPQLDGNFSIMVGERRTATWTGEAGDGKWSTEGNWKDNLGPSRDCDVVLSNPDDDFEIVNDIGELRICSLSFSGAKPFALVGNGLKLRGPGETVLCSASAAVTNAISWALPEGKTTVMTTGGKAMTLMGGFTGTGATLELKGLGYAIGGEGSIDKIICAVGGNTILSDKILGEGGVFEYAAGNLKFACGGEFLFDLVHTGTTSDYETWFNAGRTNYVFRGDFLAESFSREVRFRDSLGSMTVDFYGEVRMPEGSLHAIMKSPVTFHAPVTIAHMYGGDWANDSSGNWKFLSPSNNVQHIAPGRTFKVWFGGANVLTNALIRFDHAAGTGTAASSGYMELDGHDQVFDRIESDATRLAANVGVLWSGHYEPDWKAIPCTVTLRGTASADTSATVESAITLVWDPIDPSFTQTFRNRANGTTGDIIVKNGTFEVAGSGSFANVKRLVVGDGATFLLNTTAANALKSVTNIVLGVGGALSVESGETPFGTRTPTVDVTAFVADRAKDVGEVPVYGDDFVLRIASGQPVKVFNYDGTDCVIPVARVANLTGADNLRNATVEFVGCASPEKYRGKLRFENGVLCVEAHEKRGFILMVR